MKTTLTRLVAWVISAIVLAASPAKAAEPTIIITDLQGSMNIQLPLPCGDPVNETLHIERGIMNITPVEILVDSALFDLTRVDMFLTPFSVERSCDGIRAGVHFSEIGVQLASAVTFTGDEVGPRESRLYRFRIPKEQFLIYEWVTDDAPGHTLDGPPETAYQRPSEDVFGLIDLRRNTVELHVVLKSKVGFRVGCVRGKCLINQTETALQISDIRGAQGCSAPRSVAIEPLVDNAPPIISCTADSQAGMRFLVVATDDDCNPPTITLGSYALSNGEVIQIQQTGQPGLRLIGSNRPNGIRQFQVGRGEGVIVATDPSGNHSSAICR